MPLNLGCIVEGHGDVPAVRVLLQRIQQASQPEVHLNISPPSRVGRYKLVQPGELENAVERLVRRLAAPRAVLILIDADDDCPRELGPKLVARAVRARSDLMTSIVLAKFEFEAWFLAAMESLSGQRGLKQHLPKVPDPEAIRDAKGFLTRHMKGSRAYSETVDQPALTAVFDMQLVRTRSNSFDRCWREIERLLVGASKQGPENRL